MVCNLEYEVAVAATVRVLKADESHRFLRVEGKVMDDVY